MTDESMGLDTKYRPFYCGSQFADWGTRNCRNCHKDGPGCDIYNALTIAYCGDGAVSREVARRMGYLGNEMSHNWDCLERENILPPAEWRERLKPPPTGTAPLWVRLRRALGFALELWISPWRPEEDIYGVPGRISLRTAWSVAWGIHRNDRALVK